jgi:transposase
MEQLHYNLLYRWFIGLGVDEAVWVPTVFTKNRDRLLEAELGVRWTSAIFRLRTLQLSNPWHSLRVPQGLI